MTEDCELCIGSRGAGGTFEDGEEGIICVGHDQEGTVIICAVKGESIRQYSMSALGATALGVSIIKVAKLAEMVESNR